MRPRTGSAALPGALVDQQHAHMGRIALAAITLTAALMLSPGAASAADWTIDVGTGRTVSPSSPTIAPNDTITWNWKSGTQDDHHIVSNTVSLEVWDSGLR